MTDIAVRHGSPPEHAQEQLPEALGPSHLRMICTLALHSEHWTSLQSDEAFEKVRRRVQCVLVNTAIAAQVLTMKSLVLLNIVKTSPSYFNSTSDVPYLLLTLSSYTGITGAWLAVYSITVLQRIYDRSVLKRGCFFRAIYLLSIFTPLCCTILSLCFCAFGILAAFTSSSSAYCALAMLLLVMNAVALRTILTRFRKARQKSH
ncbi:hypothetical protein AZE42_01161 [Rhizopogon vesiculosus]|uniref:Transmembrane protein n=1 Tax=Rhizopogon vesiculosus TaxID=180088 RepID=A0A1J8PKW7_9AGAM|nr:hypothetical protein AZE42_01161 [Rhizopogon vesiculosus]